MKTGIRIQAETGTVAEFDAWASAAKSDSVATYNRDGVVCLRNAISQEWLDVIERGINDALLGASADLDVVKRKGDKGRFSFSSQAWREVKPFRRFIFDSPLADVCWPILQSDMTLFYDFLLIKEARSDSAATPWHQDHAYYPLVGTNVINCWTALDPIPVESALRFFKGSHAPEIIYRAANFENPSEDYRHVRKERPPIPDIDNDPAAEILSCAMSPGDTLIWNSHTFHAAPGNKLNQRRAAFSVNLVGDNVTYEDVPALETYKDPSFRSGDKLASDKFQVIRSRAGHCRALKKS